MTKPLINTLTLGSLLLASLALTMDHTSPLAYAAQTSPISQSARPKKMKQPTKSKKTKTSNSQAAPSPMSPEDKAKYIPADTSSWDWVEDQREVTLTATVKTVKDGKHSTALLVTVDDLTIIVSLAKEPYHLPAPFPGQEITLYGEKSLTLADKDLTGNTNDYPFFIASYYETTNPDR